MALMPSGRRGRGYTRAQVGASSRFGAARTGTARRVLNPWGNTVPQKSGVRTNALGQSITKTTRLKRGAVSLQRPDPSLYSISYPANDPAQWPIEGGKRGPTSAMTQAKADVHNAAVNHAFQRTTGLA